MTLMKESGCMNEEFTTIFEAGTTLDHYRLEATVAQSGRSTLYRATDLSDGKQVLLKIPHLEMETDPVLLERFKREEEIGQHFHHPGIVKIFDGGDRSRLYMVMEWVDGRPPAGNSERAGGARRTKNADRTCCEDHAWHL